MMKTLIQQLKTATTIKLCSICCLAIFSHSSIANNWSGHISTELRHYKDDALFDTQQNNNVAFAFEPKYYQRFQSNQTLNIMLFMRNDENDSKRDYIDIREFNWVIPGDNWELQLGISKVFWGVTEAVNPVDIINQTDLAENSGGGDKLGQPMIRYSLYRDWSNMDFFILPRFRERTFPGINGRLRTDPAVNTDSPLYESGDKDNHIDHAIRWSHSLDLLNAYWDIGISHFSGTNRDAKFVLNTSIPNSTQLQPFYSLIDQTGIDLQVTTETWLWKLEAINRSGKHIDNFQRAAAGFEYTFISAFDSNANIGLVVEYLYDDLNENASTAFENDALIALRLTLNDIQSTELLAGFITDLDSDTYVFSLEASRRLGQSFKLEIETNVFENVHRNDSLFNIRNDSYIEIELAYYF